MVDGSDFENTLAHHLPIHLATPKGLHLDFTTIIAVATLTCAIQVLLTSSTRCSRQCEWTASTRPRPHIIADWFSRKPSDTREMKEYDSPECLFFPTLLRYGTGTIRGWRRFLSLKTLTVWSTQCIVPIFPVRMIVCHSSFSVALPVAHVFPSI